MKLGSSVYNFVTIAKEFQSLKSVKRRLKFERNITCGCLSGWSCWSVHFVNDD